MRPFISRFSLILLGAALLASATGCAAAQPTPANLQWTSPPAMAIDPAKYYLATLKTAKGDIKVELFAAKTPLTVNNFVFLARQGFYNNTTFHRVLENFMAQAGDPTGTGSGGAGYTFADEIVPGLDFSQPGMLAMANSGANTNSSQFFITTAATTWLNGKHTVFGRVISGMEVVRALTLRDPQQNPTFPGDLLSNVIIEESGASFGPTATPTITPKRPTVQPGRPLATLDVLSRQDLFNMPPAMTIDLERSYKAEVKTTKGKIVIELYDDTAPRGVNNFVLLANLGYWDNFPISFINAGVFALTGSPTGSPTSDIGYSLDPEFNRPNVAGSVGYWIHQNRPGSSGSMFYILLQDKPELDYVYSVFGKVIEGLDVASTLTAQDKIETITIIEE